MTRIGVWGLALAAVALPVQAATITVTSTADPGTPGDGFCTLRDLYNGQSFHRVVPNFVIQAGDPRGDSNGGPGYTIRDEVNRRAFVRGTAGMARDGKNTAGSQFFITHLPQPHLDGDFTAFGQVTKGMDVVDRIEPGDTILEVAIWDGQSFSGARPSGDGARR